MQTVVPSHDIVMMTLDTLRFDVARRAYERGAIPNFAALLPAGGWERRHAPGSFTYASHQAFFAGFLPTPTTPGPHPRLFAAAFEGSETTTARTCVFDAPTIVEGLADRGYRTICIGGTGFFNGRTPLGRVLPRLFHDSHWAPALGVTEPRSTENQFRLAAGLLGELDPETRAFLFINVSALHQPNYFYLEGAREDDPRSQEAALVYVDSQLPVLRDALAARGRSFVIVCSDHGTAYGEDGHVGHRLAHPVVWDVPYAHFFVEGSS